MKITELAKFVGKRGQWRTGKNNDILVDVEVTNARQSYGRVDLCVTPVAGQGEAWVDSDSVECLK